MPFTFKLYIYTKKEALHLSELFNSTILFVFWWDQYNLLFLFLSENNSEVEYFMIRGLQKLEFTKCNVIKCQ